MISVFRFGNSKLASLALWAVRRWRRFASAPGAGRLVLKTNTKTSLNLKTLYRPRPKHGLVILDQDQVSLNTGQRALYTTSWCPHRCLAPILLYYFQDGVMGCRFIARAGREKSGENKNSK